MLHDITTFIEGFFLGGFVVLWLAVFFWAKYILPTLPRAGETVKVKRP